MRYWIYWNELVQGPFEVSELVSLHAFRADLLICEEGKEDWTPASAISELAYHFQVVNVAPPTAPPPPPPPRPPTLFPLQGEFFSESSAQQPLFDLNGTKDFTYRPAQEASAAVPDLNPPPVTSPFRFSVIAPPLLEPPPLEIHPARPSEGLPHTHRTLPYLPPGVEIMPSWIEEPLTVMPEDHVETPTTPSVTALPPVKAISYPPLEKPQPVKPQTPVEKPPQPEIPAPIKPEPFIKKTATPPVIRDIPPRKVSATVDLPSLDLEEPRLWPWMLAALVCLGIIAMALFIWWKHSPSSMPLPVEAPAPVAAPIPAITPSVTPVPAAAPAPVAAKPEPAPSPLPPPAPEIKETKKPPVTKLAVKHVVKKTAVKKAPEKVSNGSIVVSAWHALGEAGPETGHFTSPAGVSVGAPGLIWVADQGNHRLQSYDPATQVWTPLGKQGDGSGEFHMPAAVAVDTQGRMWVADQGNNRVQVYDPIKQAWSVVGKPGIAKGQFHSPTGVTVDDQQHVWVVDQGNNRLQVYNPATKKWNVIGKSGQGPGQFKAPRSVAVDAQKRVWVTDQGNNRVQMYDPATKKWSVLGQSGESSGEFNAPAGIAVDDQQRVWVTDQGNNRVQVYDPVVKQWAIVGKQGEAAGEFNAPLGIAVDSQQRVWVADQGNHRLQMTQILSAGLPVVVNGINPVPVSAASGVSPTAVPASVAKPAKVIPAVSAPSTPPIPAATPVPASVVSPALEATHALTPALPSTTSEPAARNAEGGTRKDVDSSKNPSSELHAPSTASVGSTPSFTEPPIQSSMDPWRGKEQQAIAMALQQKIYTGKRTVGINATLMLEDMHEKELLHAGDTGERLYLPDKIEWTALHEEGPHYRVYLNFMAWQANGERIQARSDQFAVDLQKKTVTPEDESTRHDFFDSTNILHHQHNPKADDIESVLSAVDLVNRQKVRAVILKSDKKDKDEQKNIQNALQAAEAKFERMIIYFRTKYAEKTLQNVGKAYLFPGLLKGK